MDQPEVFYTPEWALAMQSSYPTSLKPLLFLSYEDDSLAAIVALASDPAGKTISFLASTTGDYCDFLSAPQRREQFVDGVFAELAKFQPEQIVLANLPADSATPSALHRASRKYGFHVFFRPAYACAQVELGAGQLRKQLKSSTLRKKMLQRKLRALERAGRVSYSHLQTWDEIELTLQSFMNAHVLRFQSTGRTSSLATGERRHFVEDLARQFSGSGVVTLSILRVNDQPIAWNYGFQFCGSWFWYQPTFDGRWEEFSPGYCLLAKIIAEACDMEGMKRVDLGLGDEGYKERFGNSTRQTLHVTASKSWRRHLQEIVRYRAAGVLRRAPRVDTAVRRMLGR